MAEYIVVDAYLLHEIPDEISYDQGTFIEPTAAAYQTFEMMPLTLRRSFLGGFWVGEIGAIIGASCLRQKIICYCGGWIGHEIKFSGRIWGNDTN